MTHAHRALAISAVAMLAVSPAAGAPTYVPVAPSGAEAADDVEINRDTVLFDSQGVARLREESAAAMADTAPAGTVPASADTQCATIPTIAEVKASGFEFRQSLLSRAGAFKVGLPVFQISATGDELVLVRDYSRIRECTATDGTTVLQYGQAIRTVVTISNVSGDANLTLPAVAANATISSKKNQLAIQVLGFENPAMVTAAASVSSKELNVESYGEYANVFNKLVELSAASGTQHTSVRLGIIPRASPSEIAEAAVVAWAIQQISSGRSCEDAKSRLPQTPPSEPAAKKEAISGAYISVTGKCTADRPSNLQQAQAKEFLYRLKVS